MGIVYQRVAQKILRKLTEYVIKNAPMDFSKISMILGTVCRLVQRIIEIAWRIIVVLSHISIQFQVRLKIKSKINAIILYQFKTVLSVPLIVLHGR